MKWLHRTRNLLAEKNKMIEGREIEALKQEEKEDR
jgi:hypothetical protein